MRRARAALVLVLTTACGGSTPPPATPAAAVTGTPRFCAYGGVGIVPDPLPPGYETDFASIVVEVENDTGSAIPGVSVTGGGLVGADGAPIASLRRVEHLVVIDRLEPESASVGSFGVYLGSEGRPFDGTLPPGRTILRARFSLDTVPAGSPDHCRLELSVGTPLAIDVPLGGVWATS